MVGLRTFHLLLSEPLYGKDCVSFRTCSHFESVFLLEVQGRVEGGGVSWISTRWFFFSGRGHVMLQCLMYISIYLSTCTFIVWLVAAVHVNLNVYRCACPRCVRWQVFSRQFFMSASDQISRYR